MYDTVDFIVQNENEKLSREEQFSHPKMVKERNWQLKRLKMMANNQ